MDHCPDVVTVSVTEEIGKLIQERYSFGSAIPSSDYILFQSRIPGCVITLYAKRDDQGKRKVVFQGKQAKKEASFFEDSLEKKVKPRAEIHLKPKTPYAFQDQCGSDEVGTGCFFGPVVVCAAYVDREGLKEVERLGVTDSKKMNDAYIRSIGKELATRFDHSLLVLRNEKYNQIHDDGLNMNEIKAKMHNRCLLNLKQRHPLAKFYQDQFAPPGLYYRYLNGEKEIVEGITFETKGESKFPSVAVGSVLARYSFLLEMDKLSESIGEIIPQGAGANVDAFCQKLKQKRPDFQWRNYVKTNFANYEKLFKKDS